MAEKTIEQLKAELEKAKAAEKAANEKNEALLAEVNAYKAKEEEANKVSVPAVKPVEMVKYTAPIFPGLLEDDLQVSINGKRWTIMRGVEVEIPKNVKDIIDRADRMKLEAQRNATELRNKYEKAVKADAM